MNKSMDVFSGRLKIWESFHQFFEDIPNLKALTMIVKNEPYPWYGVGAIFSAPQGTVSFQKSYFDYDELKALSFIENADQDFKVVNWPIDKNSGRQNQDLMEDLYAPLRNTPTEILNILATESASESGEPFRALTRACFLEPFEHMDVLSSFFGSSFAVFQKVMTEKNLRAVLPDSLVAPPKRI